MRPTGASSTLRRRLARQWSSFIPARIAIRSDAEREKHLNAIRDCAAYGASLGLEIHAGHGLSYDKVKPIAAIPEIRELNIGHFLVGEAIFVGLERRSVKCAV